MQTILSEIFCSVTVSTGTVSYIQPPAFVRQCNILSCCIVGINLFTNLLSVVSFCKRRYAPVGNGNYDYMPWMSVRKDDGLVEQARKLLSIIIQVPSAILIVHTN